MARNQRDQTYDQTLLMKDAGLIATSAAATVATVAKVADFGASRMDARLIIDITACENASNDELFTVEVQVSNSATFASGVFIAGNVKLGAAEATFESADTALGRREVAFATEINGVTYRYCRVFTRVAGTIATGVNYTAHIVRDA